MKTYIEIGANRGTDSHRFITEDSRLFCFEPAQELYYSLWQQHKDKPNVMVLPFAVDIESGIKKFNVQGAHDWGCSSLHDYNDNLDNRWPDRVTNEFIFTHSYNVFTIRLDQFFLLYNITQVDYIWIDAQGNDFRILQSAGDMISIIKQGKCEAAGTCELYKNTDNTYENIYSYLTERNFKVGGNPDLYETDMEFLNLGM
jgi:FkbM family methyltransferase